MLAYEYASKALSTSHWVVEKRKRLQKFDKKPTYIDFTIPILSGALAGMFSQIFFAFFKLNENNFVF